MRFLDYETSEIIIIKKLLSYEIDKVVRSLGDDVFDTVKNKLKNLMHTKDISLYLRFNKF